MKYLNSLVLALPLPFIIFGVAPITMFLGNLEEYTLNLSSILGLFCVFLAAFFVLTALFILASRADTIVRVLSGIVIGVSISALIHIFIWDFGPLDGRGIIWKDFNTNIIFEIAAWLLICTLMFFLAIRRLDIRGLLATSKSVFFLAVLSLLYPLFSSIPNWNSLSSKQYKPIEEAFAFHPENNAIIIVLDTFQGDIFQEISERFPEESAFLSGFSYYPDAVSGYPTTKHSIPQILTGQFYTNQIPWTKETQKAFYSEDYLPKYYLDKGYGVTGDFHRFEFNTLGSETSFAPNIRDYSFFGLSEEQMKFIDVGLFRAAPIFLKESIYKEGGWFLSRIRSDINSPPPPHGSDFRFVQNFINNANISSKKNGEFKFIHLMGAHYPLFLNEKAEYIGPQPDSREAFLNQSRGALRLAKELITTLKKIGVYDKANILVISDHGAAGRQPYDLKEDINRSQIELTYLGAARPLFLHKPSGSQGLLRHNNTPVHLSFVPCFLSGFEGFSCQDAKKSFEGEEVLRKHYRYNWRHEFWFKKFSPSMTLYEIKGDSRNISSWKDTGILYEDGSIKSP